MSMNEHELARTIYSVQKGLVAGVIVQCRRGSKGPGLSKVSIFAPFKPMESKIWAIFACAASTGLVLRQCVKFVSQVYFVTFGVASRSVRMKAGFS